MGWRKSFGRRAKQGLRSVVRGRGFEKLEVRWAFSIDMPSLGSPDLYSVLSVREPGPEEQDLIIVGTDEFVKPVDWTPPTITTELDDQGRVVTETVDSDTDGDGADDFRNVTRYSYGENPNSVTMESSEDSGIDGVIDSRWTSLTVTDANGLVVESLSSSDYNADGINDSSYSQSFRYDAEGRMTGSSTIGDNDGDGVPEYRNSTMSAYDAAGNLLSQESEDDINHDGVVDQRSTSSYEYDSAGRLLANRQTYDQDGNGAIDSSWVSSLTYDAQGAILTETQQQDVNGDGAFDYVQVNSYAYTPSGNYEVIATALDQDGNGSIDYASSVRYTYDENGVATAMTSEIDSNGDGIIDQTEVTDLTQIVYLGGPADGGPVIDGGWDKEDPLYYFVDQVTVAMRSGVDNLAYDVNSDGLVDETDRLDWIMTTSNSYVGDANLDGVFDSEDLILAFQAGQYEDETSGNSTWSTGDWNGDGEFDSADLIFVLQHGGYEAGPRVVAGIDVGEIYGDESKGEATDGSDREATDVIFADDFLLSAASSNDDREPTFLT